MPRTYISRNDDGTAELQDQSAMRGIAGAIEGVALGNTNFDDINNPITAFNFVLEVEGVYFLALKSVRAFTKENEYEYIREGGVNDYVHMKRKPISKPFTFQIERYVGTERFLDPLANGTELILPLILYVYRHASRAGITESGSPAWPSRIYTFTGCTVMSKEYGGLDAEKSGLVTETTTIAYRELVVLTNPFNSMTENPEWNPKDDADLQQSDSPGYKTKYAVTSTHDKHDNGTYKYEWTTEDGVSRMKMKEDVGFEFAAPVWDGDPEHSTRPKMAGPDNADETYEDGTVDGKPAKVRKDTSDFNRPAYQFAVDGSRAKYASQSAIDTNEGEKIYDDVPGKDGKKHKTRVDHAENNKPAWSGEKDTMVSWAAQSAPDKAGSTYSIEKKNGNKIVKRKDSGQFNQVPYEIGKDKTRNKRAEVSAVDKNAAAAIYEQENGHTVRKDKSDVNKGAYDIDRDRSTARYANESPKSRVKPVERPPYSIEEDGVSVKYAKVPANANAKPEAKDPYSIKKDGSKARYAETSPKDVEKPTARDPYKIKDGSKAKYAAKSPKDSEKPEARGPYKISDGSGAKFAAKSPKDSEKPQARDPYSIKTDGAKAKHAVPSAKDKPLATPVTWPPTRRALMAENLKK